MRVKFKASIISILTLMIVLVGASISGLFWIASSDIAEKIAEDLFENQTVTAKNTFLSLLKDATVSAAVGSKQAHVKASPTDFLESSSLEMMLETLRQYPAFYSLYYGFGDGTFFQVIATRELKTIIDKHDAPQETFWIVRSIVQEDMRLQKWAFLSKEGNVLTQRIEKSPTYNPSKRPWYKSAINQVAVQLSEPYWFNSLQKPGITTSKKIEGIEGVIGVDLTLEGVRKEISSIAFSENGGLILHDRNNRLIALSDNLGDAKAMSDISTINLTPLNVFRQIEEGSKLGVFKVVESRDDVFFVRKDKITFAGMDFYLGAVAPVDDFKSIFITLQQNILILSILGLVIFLPFSYLFASQLAQKVTDVTHAANRVRELDFDAQELAESNIVEFNELIHSFAEMSKSLGNKTEALKLAQAKLARLVDLGISMSAEQDSDKLMEMVLMGAKDLTNADGCSLYVIDENQQLEFKIFRNDSLDISFGGTTGKKSKFPSIALFNEDGSQNLSNLVSYVVHKEQSINVDDTYQVGGFDFSGPRSFDEQTGYHSKSILTVPLKPRGGAIIGALQIVNAQDKESGDVIAFVPEVQPFIEALSAQAATSLYNRNLLKGQEKLMDGLIQLIAGAIDAKSPYTGGHCERVPILAKSLAEHASAATFGSFADFHFKTRDEWREFEIGAWLHDCGKVVTPEYVVDKATKLETIYNRIHEIRTRFEVLMRDAKIDNLQTVIDGADPKQALQDYEIQKQKLIDDYAFVAQCNVGSELMPDEDVERLKQIAETIWQRNFDIHLGLAHEEALRYEDEPIGPCAEKLLDDKELHIMPRIREVKDLFAERGFKVEVPDNLYNKGEFYNLSVKHGTLTQEERFKINEHITQSIMMLEQLPLPAHLKRIPEYAGTHHETMMGTGYPRQLSADELTIPARIMAIADIFEALTASDRPYKKAKTLSESVDILSKFKTEKHIDGELFDLFLTSGVYLEYAQKFLLPEQIDQVEISQYLG